MLRPHNIIILHFTFIPHEYSPVLKYLLSFIYITGYRNAVLQKGYICKSVLKDFHSSLCLCFTFRFNSINTAVQTVYSPGSWICLWMHGSVNETKVCTKQGRSQWVICHSWNLPLVVTSPFCCTHSMHNLQLAYHCKTTNFTFKVRIKYNIYWCVFVMEPFIIYWKGIYWWSI